MPRWESSAPRKKLPPPTTIAISTSVATEAISLAMELTTSGFTPRDPPPKDSPESLRRTRRLLDPAVMSSPLVVLLQIIVRWRMKKGTEPHQRLGPQSQDC